VITFPSIAAGFLLSFVNPAVTPRDALLGVLIGGFFPTLVLIVYKWIRKREGLGHGDIFMLAMVGAFLGWKGVLLVLFFSSIFGSLIGIVMMLVLRKS